MNERERENSFRAFCEGVLLGMMMLDNRCIEKVIDVGPKFTTHAHNLIYATILGMYPRLTADQLTVCEDLAKTGVLADVGGPAYVARLVSDVTGIDDVMFFAEKLGDNDF